MLVLLNMGHWGPLAKYSLLKITHVFASLAQYELSKPLGEASAAPNTCVYIQTTCAFASFVQYGPLGSLDKASFAQTQMCFCLVLLKMSHNKPELARTS